MAAIYSLPCSVVTQIFNCLTWREKIDLVNAIPEMKNSLSSISSWCYLEYNHDEVVTDIDADSFATNFIACITEYGKQFQNIRLAFSKENPDSILQLLKEISNKCINLTALELEHFCANYKCKFPVDYFQQCSEVFCDILQKCPKLRSVNISSFVTSTIEDSTGLVTLLTMIIGKKLTQAVTEIDFLLLSPYDVEFDYHYFVQCFENLRKLAVRREFLSKKIMLELMNKPLNELALYTDGESDTLNYGEIESDIWKSLISKCPDLSVAIELKQLNVTLKDFPQYLPITKIALTFFSTGVKLENLLRHFVDSYNKTLTLLYFILDDSEEDGELELNDQFRQLSSVLVDTVAQCPKLTHLKYNIPLSSSMVLNIARQRKLKDLCLYENKVSYEKEYQFASSTDDFPKNQEELEESVSVLLDRKWCLTPDEEYEILNH